MNEKKLALVYKLAEKMSDDEVVKMASERLTADELEKIADMASLFADADKVLDAGRAGMSALRTDPMVDGTLSGIADVVGRVPGVAKHVGKAGLEFAKNHPVATGVGAGAGVLGAGALAYLTHKALQNMYGASEDQGNERLASVKATVPAETREGLDKLAEDPGVMAACYTLVRYGLV